MDQKRKVEVLPYDANWENLFLEAKEELESLFDAYMKNKRRDNKKNRRESFVLEVGKRNKRKQRLKELLSFVGILSMLLILVCFCYGMDKRQFLFC